MHLIISRVLHNWAGVQYQDNSFRVARVPGMNTDLQDGSWTGKLFKVSGLAVGARNPKVRFRGKLFQIYAPQNETKDLINTQTVRSRSLSFYGELGMYKGDWQFVIRDVSWVQ